MKKLLHLCLPKKILPKKKIKIKFKFFIIKKFLKVFLQLKRLVTREIEPFKDKAFQQT